MKLPASQVTDGEGIGPQKTLIGGEKWILKNQEIGDAGTLTSVVGSRTTGNNAAEFLTQFQVKGDLCHERIDYLPGDSAT